MATIIDLGELGTAVKLSPKTQSRQARLPHVAVILDVSGSMGENAPRIGNHVLPDVLEAAGYRKTDRVTLILFHSNSERLLVKGRDPTIEQLRTVDTHCRGFTYMSGVFEPLLTVCKELGRDRAVHVIALSDGAIGDTEEVLTRSAAAANFLAGWTVEVTLVCFGYGTADTRGLASLGVLATAGAVPLHEARDIPALKTRLCEVGGLGGRTARLEADAAVLRRAPNQHPKTAIDVPIGQLSTVLVAPGYDRGLLLNGLPLSVTARPLTGETQLREMLEFVGGQLKMQLVVGRKSAIQAQVHWLKRLQALLEAAAAAATEEADPALTDEPIHTTAGRVARLKRDLRGRSTGVLNGILELCNRQDVAKLNSTQQAAFLRSDLDETSSVAKGLARRVGDIDPDQDCRDALAEIRGRAPPAFDDSAAAAGVSFSSLDSWRESLQGAVDLVDDAPVIGVADLLPVVGGLGVAFVSDVSPLPDPWAIRVSHVYLGNMMLSESDRCAAASLGGNDIDYPGRPKPAPVTGVVPLRSLDAEAYDYYRTGPFRKIAALHASASIRGMTAPIPYDQLARDAAVGVAACRQLGPVTTEIERNLVGALLGNVRHALAGKFGELVGDLHHPDPRHLLIGDRGVSGPLKPLVVLLLHPGCADMSPRDRAGAMRAVYCLDAVQQARHTLRDCDRSAMLLELLGVNLDIRLTPLFEPDAPFDPATVPLVALNDVARRASVPWMADPVRLLQVARQTHPAAYSGDPAAAAEPGLSELFGMDPDRLRAFVAVELLSCPTEALRIDKASNKPSCPEYQLGWCGHIRQLVVDMLADEHERLVARKAADEAAELTRQLRIELLAASPEAFLKRLPGIQSRSAPGYKELEAELCDSEVEVRDRRFKIATVVLGRLPGNPSVEVWDSGNVLVGSADRFHALELAYKAGRSVAQRPCPTWSEVIAAHREYNLHRYRDLANRHGHHNGKPSYYAYGYLSLDAYLADLSTADATQYCVAHAGCCGVAAMRAAQAKAAGEQ